MKLKSLLTLLAVVALLIAAYGVPALPALGLPLFALALARDRTRISVKGGGLAKIREISPSQVDAFLDLGYLSGSDINDEHNVLEIIDEAGNLIDALSGGQKSYIKTMLKQSSADEINLLKNAAGKYYDFYYYAKLNNGRFQELTAIPCKIKPGPVLSFKSATERTIEVTIYFLAPKAAATRAPIGYNVTADVPYVLIEGAAATGVPTEATSTFTTLISTVL